MIASTGDQVLSSVSNAVILLAMAAASSAEAFGAAVLVMSIIIAALSCVRGFLGSPLLLMSGRPREEIAEESDYALWMALLIGLVVGAVAFVISWILAEPLVGLAYAFAVPMLLTQDILRFTAIADGRPEEAFVSDLIWAVASLGVYGAVIINRNLLTIPDMVGIWGVAAGVALLYLVVRLRARIRVRGMLDWVRATLSHRIRYGIEHGFDQVGAIAVVTVATAFIGTVAAAALRGAGVLLGPLAVVITALPLVFIPEARRAGHDERQMWSSLRYAAWISSCLAITVGFLGPLLPEQIGRLLLGESWQHAIVVLPMLGVEYAAICWLAAALNFYLARNDSVTLLRLRVSQTALVIIGCTAAAALTHSVIAVAFGLAGSSALVALVACWMVERQLRIARRGGDAEPVISEEQLAAAATEHAVPPVGSAPELAGQAR
ncbi:hypothetical protein [Millisia brevis]|uniref:hypothetical protein n=1 Tax=Millisia brevis TaxID=264148 RepID=UPI0012ED6641|nr:hypothetical protein [Millisia brevis]